MHVASQDRRTWCFAGLLAVLVSTLASQALGQPAARSSSPVPPNHLRSAAVRPRSPSHNPPHARLASVARAVSEDEIVEGGTYMVDPDTGQLYETDRMILPSQRPSAPSAAAPSRAAPSRAVPSEPAIMPTEQMVFADGAIAEPWVVDAGCADACLTPCHVLPLGNVELFAGVQGFTGPRNQGSSGSFGFHQGLNYAIPLPGFACLGGQIGFRATQSSLSGSDFTDSSRNQGFVTAGLFRRVDVGLQGGVVLDFLTERWEDKIDMTNLRGELSWVVDGTHDFGFWFSTGMNSGTATGQGDLGVATDLYAFFYRLQFGGCRDGDARLFAGWTGQSDGLIGVDARLPLTPDWALESNFAYLIPNEGAGAGPQAGHAQESWNLGISLVWYPGRLWGGGDYYYRPLFRVADNGNFMID
jgi:hypothetical protein